MAIIDGKVLSTSEMRPEAARVVVKFAPGIRLSHSEAAEAEHAVAHREAWAALRSEFFGVVLRPFFSLSTSALASLERRANAAGTMPKLSSYFAIVVPHGTDPAAVAHAVAEWEHVELAYVEGGPVPPPVNAADDPLSGSQGYLSAAPTGIDAVFAWAEADGSGIGLIDLEQGWTLDHEDLPSSIPVIGPGVFMQDPNWIAHGTAVLGIVAGIDNDKGVIGIAPQTSVRVVSQWFETSGVYFFSTANAIASAIAEMRAGDVLLIETTAPPVSKFGWVPAEADPLVFDLIKMATSIGITVLEPAGNNFDKPGTKHIGGSNLDAFTNNGKFVLNRISPDFKDSGAILVGAGSSKFPHERLGFSNFGSRIDCYAWGQNIATCGNSPFLPTGASPQTAYMMDFGGTSGATAIIAGAAVLLQSWAAKELGSVLSTATLRALLSDPTLNTKSKTPINDGIGVMPDLRRIIHHLKSIAIHSKRDAIISLLFGGVIYDGGGWKWTPGSPPTPVPPRSDRGQLSNIPADNRDVLIGLALLELAALINDKVSRKEIEKSIALQMRNAMEKIEARIENAEY